MMTNEDIITEVVNETDMKTLLGGTVEDIERFINTIISKSLIELGDIEDELE